MAPEYGYTKRKHRNLFKPLVRNQLADKHLRYFHELNIPSPTKTLISPDFTQFFFSQNNATLKTPDSRDVIFVETCLSSSG
jgi:hypothetical protein